MNMLRVICFICLIITANISHAKWAGFEEASIKMDINNQDIIIKKDGTYESIIEEEFEILKESARDKATRYTLYYDGDSQKIEILEAKTIFQGKEYPIDPKFIEDKPLASSSEGFDQQYQILLAFPKIEIGSKIYLKYKKTINTPPLDNYFSAFFEFGSREWLANSNIKLQSGMPLNIFVNDPENHLIITKDNEDDFQKLEITLNKDIYKHTINEPENGLDNYKLLTWVSISSANNWKELGKDLAEQNFAKIYKQELPKEFNRIAKSAAKIRNEIDQINVVTSMLRDRIQFFSDNTTVEGRLAPRNLVQISKTQLGDCKDLSAATVAILSKLGYKAQFALVLRGNTLFAPEALADLRFFNHAIVKAISKTGKIYWIDPTNIQSMAGNIFPDIANKPTLVLDLKDPIYEKTPGVDPKKAVISHNREIEIISDNKIVEKGNLLLQNEEALIITGAELYTSKSNIETSLFYALSGTNLDSTNKKHMVLPELKSRTVKDVYITYSYEQDGRLFKTNLGKGLKLSYNRLGIDKFIHASQDTVSDLFIGEPNSFKRRTIIKNIDVKNAESLNREINTKWVSISRKLSFKDNILTIDDSTIVKKEIILNEELQTPEFLNLKRELEENFKDVSVVFN
ncbi:MAG: DUF3857 domain-containing protein [Rickettsiales bacterium]|jgi:hypothetical protein|nr:DUF3857 domain-containing protein [Rickettsiales bacterium]